MNYPTKEQLILWRQQGRTNAEIAKMTGRGLGTINGLFSKYKIPTRSRSLPEDKVNAICRMRKEGRSTREIVRETGLGESTVNKYLKAAGLIEERGSRYELDMETTLPVLFTIRKEPEIRKFIQGGRIYEDVTDFFAPW